MAFTYDITTPRGKVRLLCTDVDGTNAIFDDAEIDTFLLLAPANLFSAAALACETWARSQSRLDAATRAGDTTDTRRTPESLLKLAALLRDSALNGGLVTDQISTSTPGELLDSFRPEWRGINDLPVVE